VNSKGYAKLLALAGTADNIAAFCATVPKPVHPTGFPTAFPTDAPWGPGQGHPGFGNGPGHHHGPGAPAPTPTPIP
jgi:hypothetical protein